VSRVVSALIAANDVEIARKKVYHSALAFVAPIYPTDTCKHKNTSLTELFGQCGTQNNPFLIPYSELLYYYRINGAYSQVKTRQVKPRRVNFILLIFKVEQLFECKHKLRKLTCQEL